MRGQLLSLTLALIVAWFGYSMIFDSYPPIVVSEDYRVVNEQPVPRNASLKVSYRITVERACIGTGRRIFIDAGNVTYPTVAFQTDTSERADGQRVYPGDSFDTVIDAPVPSGAAPGDATYQNQTIYLCNFWQRLLRRGISVDFPKVNFKIGDQTLPRVQPSTSVFKRTDNGGIADWINHRVGWVSVEDR